MAYRQVFNLILSPRSRLEMRCAGMGGEDVSLNQLWNRRQCTKFNGTAYIVQRAAEAIYSEAGKRQVRETINYYMTNASIMRESLTAAGLNVFGGINAPIYGCKRPMAFQVGTFSNASCMKCMSFPRLASVSGLLVKATSALRHSERAKIAKKQWRV